MIPFEQALSLVLEHAAPTEPQSVCYSAETQTWSAEFLGSTLADPLVARMDSPRFDNSAVDGYAFRSPGHEFHVVKTIAAGDAPGAEIGPQEAVRIYTGAPIPLGADTVAMQEDCEVDGEMVRLTESIRPGSHVRRQGEEYRTGDVLLPAGTALKPGVVGLLASNGIDSFRFHRRPTVALATTGDELAELGTEVGPWSIYNSNGPGLAAAFASLGVSGEQVRQHRLDDDPVRTLETLRLALAEVDVLVTTGGVSVGDRDLVKDALEELGVERVFWKVAMKPGKPVYFGVRGRKLFFGLPGNPVSALLGFHLFVRPAIRAMLGHPPALETLPARLAAPVAKQAGRAEFVRARLNTRGDELVVEPSKGQGSHMLGGTADADCLIHLPTEACCLEVGDRVRVSLLRWGLI